MAEIRVTDLPVITLEDFTSNDRFIIVDDGKARQMTRGTFEEWLNENVKGERGEQGVAGRDGVNGTKGADGKDGRDGLSAYQLAVNGGFVGTEPQWRASLKGDTGSKGADGFHGWSPVIKMVAKGEENVLQLTDWVGGTGTKPALTGYIGSNGIVTNIANAVNVRGLKGDKGDKGEKGDRGDTGLDGKDGKTVASISFNQDLSATVSYTDETSVTSNTPPVQFGWGTYVDGQHSDTTAFTIQPSTQEVLPNNAVTVVEHMPTGVTTFYDPVTQKYLLQDVKGFYSVRVRFKVAPSDIASFINLSMSRGTTDIPYSEDRSLRGDSKVQEVSYSTPIYGSSALASNGLTIRVKTYDRAVSIYNIEVTVAKLI